MLIYLKNKLRHFDKVRRQNMHLFERALYRLIKNNTILQTELIPSEQVKRILIVRNNKRIGNILFLIPFIHQVRIAYPNAKIDLLLALPWQGQFFNGLGVNTVFYANFSFTKIMKWFAVRRRLNQMQYDLLIAPTCSASDAVAAAMVMSKNKVSAYNEARTLAFPHAVSVLTRRPHAAYGCLSVLEQLGHKLALPFNHHMRFTPNEINHGQDLSDQYIKNDDTINIAFFRGARGAKLLNSKTWKGILSRFEANIDKKINWVEILSPDITTPLRSNMSTFKTKDMRLLGSFLKNFDGFICCDTGPLHLADAANVKCIGLYNATNPGRYGVLGNNTVHITNLKHFDVNEISYQLGFIKQKWSVAA